MMTTSLDSNLNFNEQKNKFTYREELSDLRLESNELVKYDHNKELSLASAPCKILKGDLVNFDAHKKEFSPNTQFPAVCIELIDSDQWIKRYGLKTNKLTFENILSMIGFKKHQGR